MIPDNQTPTPQPVPNIYPVMTPNDQQTPTTPQPTQPPITQEVPKPKSKIFLLLIILLIFISLGSGGYFAYQKYLTSLKQNQTSENVTLKPTITSPSPENVSSVNCKDLDCFIEESKNCNPAQVIYAASIDIFGVQQTNTSFLEINGMESGKCKFYIKTEKIKLIFPPGVDKEIINEQTQLYQKLEGRDGTCLFNPNDLTDLLIRWSAGNYDSGTVSCELLPDGNKCTTEGGDFGTAECEGTYFESSL